MGALCSQYWHQQTFGPHDPIHAVCHLPGIVETEIHLWRALFSSMPVAIEGEHLPTEVGYDSELQSSQDSGEDDGHTHELPWGSLTVCAEILQLCKPTVSSAVWVSGLRESRKCRSRIWRSWADIVTRGLQLWGRLDLLSNSLKQLWRQFMVQKWTFNSLSTALLDIPAVSMSIARSLWYCVVRRNYILEWPFIVPSTRLTCVMIMHFNQLLDMPHLSGEWIIWAKEKCSLTGMLTNLCTKL
jgi:hypothetical protein